MHVKREHRKMKRKLKKSEKKRNARHEAEKLKKTNTLT
jgi:hypothetical protein